MGSTSSRGVFLVASFVGVIGVQVGRRVAVGVSEEVNVGDGEVVAVGVVVGV